MRPLRGQGSVGKNILVSTGAVSAQVFSAVTLAYSGDDSVFCTDSHRQRQNLFNRPQMGFMGTEALPGPLWSYITSVYIQLNTGDRCVFPDI